MKVMNYLKILASFILLTVVFTSLSSAAIYERRVYTYPSPPVSVEIVGYANNDNYDVNYYRYNEYLYNKDPLTYVDNYYESKYYTTVPSSSFQNYRPNYYYNPRVYSSGFDDSRGRIVYREASCSRDYYDCYPDSDTYYSNYRYKPVFYAGDYTRYYSDGAEHYSDPYYYEPRYDWHEQVYNWQY
jgi:hypothetical protein